MRIVFPGKWNCDPLFSIKRALDFPVYLYKIMMMLKELKNVRQVAGEGLRRWFIDDDMELILWYDANGKLEGFQICYDNVAGTRTVTWKHISTQNGSKSILLSDGPYNRTRLFALVDKSTVNLDKSLRKFILGRLKAHRK